MITNKHYLNKLLFLLFLLISNSITGQNIKIISWNIKDFGKSRDSKEILNIAKLLRNADIVAIQEVVAKDPGGAQAVARLASQLDRMGADWDYVISDMTQSPSSYIRERYAFLWKKHKVKLFGKARLISELSNVVHREPFLAKFKFNGKSFSILSYHACTHKQNFPERAEIIHISQWISQQGFNNIIWAGDMNLVVDDRAFDLIKVFGFETVLNGEKTSLKKTCKKGNYLSRAEDNIFINLKDFIILDYKVIDFISNENCNDVSWKRNIYSDHLPIQLAIK